MSVRHVVAPGCPVLQGAFCHASVHNNSTIYISGTIGTTPNASGDGYSLVQGGIAAQVCYILLIVYVVFISNRIALV